jgi:hypothetical protein
MWRSHSTRVGAWSTRAQRLRGSHVCVITWWVVASTLAAGVGWGGPVGRIR